MTNYPVLKPSGIVWLGDIPKHWKVEKLKRLLKEPLRYGANEAAELEDENLPRYIRITDFGHDGNLKDDTFKSLPLEIAKNYLVHEGDILFARSGATVGKTFQFKNYKKGLACFAGYLIKAVPEPYLLKSDFLNYYTKSPTYEVWKDGIFTQSTIQNIGADKYAALPVPVPPIQEQNAITHYLDQATQQIDEALRLKKEQLEQLDTYRKALIHEMVTKGLVKNVPLSKSGVDWIGEVPKHWKVDRLRDVCFINTETLSANTNKAFELAYIDISNVNKEGIISYENIETITFGEAPSRARRIVKDKDIIVSSVRPNLQAIAFIDFYKQNLICSTGFHVVRPLNCNYNSKFIYYYLLSESAKDYFVSMAKGVGYPAIGDYEFGNLSITIPPKAEQQAIVTFLDEKIEQIASAKANIKAQIAELEAYRKSLIYECVTGKRRILNVGEV